MTVIIVLGVTLTIVALSVFLIVIGTPYSRVSASCYSAPECSKLSTIIFVPTPLAVIPLPLGIVIALGVVKKRMILAWSGTILLLIFSLALGFSIGLFYLPLAIALLGLVGAFKIVRLSG